MRSRRGALVGSTVIAVALLWIANASAVNYFTGNLGTGAQTNSGWNYWYAQESYKDAKTERLGFQNDAGTSRYITDSDSYGYVTKDHLTMGGYMFAWIKNMAATSCYNQAYVCVC